MGMRALREMRNDQSERQKRVDLERKWKKKRKESEGENQVKCGEMNEI